MYIDTFKWLSICKYIALPCGVYNLIYLKWTRESISNPTELNKASDVALYCYGNIVSFHLRFHQPLVFTDKWYTLMMDIFSEKYNWICMLCLTVEGCRMTFPIDLIFLTQLLVVFYYWLFGTSVQQIHRLPYVWTENGNWKKS